MEVGVQHDDGEGKHEDGLRVPQFSYNVTVALAVPLSEDLHQSLNLLCLARHAVVSLEFPQRHVHLHPREVDVMCKAPVGREKETIKGGGPSLVVCFYYLWLSLISVSSSYQVL